LTPAISASATLSGERARRRLATISSSPEESPRRFTPLALGDTYMHASRVVRDRARRFRFDLETGELRESDHGQLVADWVELFAPVVFESHRPTVWPAEGSLLLDHLPFRVRALDASGRRIPAGRVTFDVFCAVCCGT
jgi:hypothetical protein